MIEEAKKERKEGKDKSRREGGSAARRDEAPKGDSGVACRSEKV